MQRAAVGPAVLFACVASLRAVAEEPRPPVTLLLHFVQAVRSPEVLNERCGVDRTLRACSRFFGRKLEASCAPSEDGWRMIAYAQFGVVTWVRDPDALAHEHLHIRDVRADVESLVAEVEARRFQSATACTDIASRLSVEFPAAMNEMQRRSNTTRHPEVLVASRRPGAREAPPGVALRGSAASHNALRDLLRRELRSCIRALTRPSGRE